MIDAIKKCWALLPVRFRWGALGLFVLMNISALAQLAMVGSILPFLQAISDPEGAREGRVLSALRSIAGPVEDTTLLMLLGALVIAAVVTANLIGAVRAILGARFASRLNAYLSIHLLRSYLNRPYPFFLNRNTSEFFRNIFSEVYLVTGGFLQTGMGGIAQLLTILGLSVLLIIVNPWIAIGAGVFFGGSYTLIYVSLRSRIARAADQRAECDNLRFKAVAEAFGTIKEVKVLRRESNFVRAFEKPSRRFFRTQERAQLYSILPKNVVETIAFAGMVGVSLVMVHIYDGVTGALPVLGLFAVAAYRLIPAIQGLYSAFSRLRYCQRSVETVYKECASLDDDQNPPIPPSIPAEPLSDRLPLNDSFQLRGVTFTYPESERPAIRGIDLEIPARSRIGLCGKSGSGKTTLADIVLGLLEPQEGQMKVDGVTINGTNRASWQRNCGYVPQEIFLADDSIRCNIAFGIATHEIDDERVKAAARLANLDGFIESELPSAYETEVGERGVRLSGGQRQRIGIARALYHDPDVIVLDEATSSLDPETERAIVEAVESLAGQKTIIMIAHRYSTIRHADFVVFMDEGKVAATGSYDELSAANANFRRMAEA